MSTLPWISYRDLCRCVTFFAQESSGIGSPQIRGRNRNGVPFSIHVRPDILQHVLRYLDVSRAEFFTWYRS